MNENYEVIKLALIKACKCLRELNGINPFVVPVISDTRDSDIDGNTWLLYFIEEAEGEINGTR